MSSARINRGIVTWMKKQIFVKRKDGECSRFVLHHVGTNGKLGTEICTINIGEHKEPHTPINEDDIAGYATEIETDANQYAEAIGATQTFAIAAYFEDDPDRAIGRHPFRVNVESPEDNDDVASEPSNLTGLVKQQMRHNEMLMRINTGSMGSMIATLQKQNEQLSTMVTKLFEDRVEQIDAVESLMSGKHQRDLEVEQARLNGVQKSQLFESFLALLPAAANKMIGKRILPETQDVIQLQIVKLMEAMTPEEIEGMLNAINSPEKKIAMIELLKLVQDRVGAIGDEPAQTGLTTTNNKSPS